MGKVEVTRVEFEVSKETEEKLEQIRQELEFELELRLPSHWGVVYSSESSLGLELEDQLVPESR